MTAVLVVIGPDPSSKNFLVGARQEKHARADTCRGLRSHEKRYLFISIILNVLNSQLLRQIQSDAGANQADPYLQVFQLRDHSCINNLTHCVRCVTWMDEEARDVGNGMIL